MKQILLVVLSGAFFSVGDFVARRWGQESSSIFWFMLMVLSGTAAYVAFGILTRSAEFSRAVIWVSISLTTFSCLMGVVWLQDSLTWTKALALILALAAAYLSTI